jgi:outer membrane immunogenic protein
MEGKMKKLLSGGVVVAALLAGPAMAADLAVRAPAPVYRAPPPVYIFSWTGCYVGGNIGGLWAHKSWTDRTPGDPFFGSSFGTHDPSSFLGGAQVGCDYQVGGWVFGVAGDYDWTNANSSNVNVIFPGLSDQSHIKSLASVTGRIGYAWDRFLGYVKGGGAWERDDYTVTGVVPFFGAVGATASETRGGWTIGVGGEYAFTNFLSGFVEYDYYNFGTRTNTFVCGVVCTPAGAVSFPVDIQETKNVFKVGLNWRFGGKGKAPAPVVTKY